MWGFLQFPIFVTANKFPGVIKKSLRIICMHDLKYFWILPDHWFSSLQEDLLMPSSKELLCTDLPEDCLRSKGILLVANLFLFPLTHYFSSVSILCWECKNYRSLPCKIDSTVEILGIAHGRTWRTLVYQAGLIFHTSLLPTFLCIPVDIVLNFHCGCGIFYLIL